MKTVQDIIQEALEYRYNEERREKQSILDRLFDFSTFGRKYEEKGNSSVILYLSERLANEIKEKQIALRKEGEAYHRAISCLEIFSPDSARKFYELWNSSRLNRL